MVNIDFNLQKIKVKKLTNTDVYSQKFNQLFSANISGNLVQDEDFIQISTITKLFTYSNCLQSWEGKEFSKL